MLYDVNTKVEGEDECLVPIYLGFHSNFEVVIQPVYDTLAKLEKEHNKIFQMGFYSTAEAQLYKDKLSSVKNTLDTLVGWNNSCFELQRAEISGAEFWGIVNNISSITERVSERIWGNGSLAKPRLYMNAQQGMLFAEIASQLEKDVSATSGAILHRLYGFILEWRMLVEARNQLRTTTK